jgi:hypothetical protein
VSPLARDHRIEPAFRTRPGILRQQLFMLGFALRIDRRLIRILVRRFCIQRFVKLWGKFILLSAILLYCVRIVGRFTLSRQC